MKSSKLVAVGVLIAASVVHTPAAVAAPGDPAFLALLAPVTLAADGPGAERYLELWASEPVVLENLKVTFDATALAGIAEVSMDSAPVECVAAGAVTTCTWSEPEYVDYGSTYPKVWFQPVAGAAGGAVADLVVTASADGVPASTTRTRVSVGEGVDLAVPDDLVEASARFGNSLNLPMAVTNVGVKPVQGAVAVLGLSHELLTASDHSNCRYADPEPEGRFGWAFCEFDTEFEPGVTYRASLVTTVSPVAQAPKETDGYVQWLTPAEWDDLKVHLTRLGKLAPTRPGTGTPLTLISQTASRSALVQADTEPTNNTTSWSVNITGTNEADAKVNGATVSGDQGTVVGLAVSVHNKGPAEMANERMPGPGVSLWFEVPPGTTAVGVPDRCFPMIDRGGGGELPDFENGGRPGAERYTCSLGSSFFDVGATFEVPLKLRIDRVISNATGQVRLSSSYGDQRPDGDNRDNAARIIVNPLDGGGAGLPVTGDNTILYVLGGAGLLVLGGVGFLAARQRRIRFVA